MNWFDVSKTGLAKLLERRGKAFAITELIQNAWDTAAGVVRVSLKAIEGRPQASIEVEDDDPTGFENLAHAFTLFAESNKKGDVEKRGRFNLGEKLVLALCTDAAISSTKGTVLFDETGRHQSKAARQKGSKFYGTIKMTHAEVEDALAVIQTLIPPKGVVTYVNDQPLQAREPLARFEAYLPTEVADAEGILRRSERKTTVEVYEPQPGETASVYELGIPVVETGDKYHINVLQKVPLNFDRDNLPPAYLRKLRVFVLNEMSDKLTKDDANSTWVRDAGSDKDASDEAMTKVMDLRFGEKRVVYDPSDPEANARAVAEGYTVIHGGMLNAHEWQNVKRAGAAAPAGQVTPSPKPYSKDGEPLKTLPPEKWTPAIRRIVTYAQDLARELLGVDGLDVTIATEVAWPYGATYGDEHLVFNLGRLGYRWFDQWSDDVERLLIHEFAHHYESDHLSERYYDACCRLGAKLARLALVQPPLFEGKPLH